MKLKIGLLLLVSFLCTLTLCLCFSACDDDSSNLPGQEKKVKDGTNINKNDDSKNALLSQLQFPHVKGGTSEVISHSTEAYGLNYSIEWDHQLRAQRWTCYVFNPQNAVSKWSRNQWKNTEWGGDPFQLDPKVPSSEQPPVTGEFSSSYYPGTGTRYDRGHICASQDRMCSMEVNEQTFYMTNMMPQVNDFNSGIWAKMEGQLRAWNISSFRDVLYICKGGTIDKESQILSRTRSGFIVPRYFFMAVLCKEANTYKALGFWVEHLDADHSDDSLREYVVNIDRLEQLTGLDFFCNLPDEIEDEVESASRNQIISEWKL